MDFPILDLMDEAACYHRLLGLLHPDGLTCPGCGGGRDRYTVHRRSERSPVVAYRCEGCRRVFNLFTGTPWQGTHRTPAEVLLVLRGFAQGVPTARLARELKASRPHLLALRHRVQARAAAASDKEPLPDRAVEADEAYQNAGEKGGPHRAPDDPPRRRANKGVGHGTWDADRPPVCGVVGRSSGRLALRAGHRNWASELVHQTVVPRTSPGATVYTDEWPGYAPLGAAGRGHATVNHGAKEWARGGDGVREVHCNTLEGLWTGLRNFLRPFRDVNKKYLEHYIKMFGCSYNTKAVADGFLRVMIGGRTSARGWTRRRPTTRSGT